MLDIDLNLDQSYSGSSDKITTEAGKKYLVSTEVIGIMGQPFSAYFGVVIFDKNKNECARRIHWLNDFSGSRRTFNKVFEAPNASEYVQIIYRINNETPLKSHCRYIILSPNEIAISEADSYLEENYDLPDHYVLPSAEELSPEQELTLEKNLVWIFGAPRSGTTWLGSQLLSYQTYYMDEPYIGYHLGSLATLEVQGRTLRWIDILRNKASYFFSYRYMNTRKFYLRKFILNRIYTEFQDLTRKIIIKEPNGSIGADIISQCLPNSRIIIVLRDGRDVMDSQLDVVQEGGSATKEYGYTPIKKESRPLYIERQAKEWNEIMRAMLRAYENHASELRLLIRYEDLLADTFDLTRQIYEFLKIPIPEEELRKIVMKYSFKNIPPNLKGKGKWIRSARPGNCRKNFSDEEKNTMEEIMGAMLRKLGYSEINRRRM